MKHCKVIMLSLLTVSFIANANDDKDTNLNQKFVQTTIDPKIFVEKASAGGLAEITLAKLALEKSINVDVRHFAQVMIEDHSQTNQELADLAKAAGLPLSDAPSLLKKAKAFALSQRDGESFDEAYANNQVTAHEEALLLFRQAANSPDSKIREFAKSKVKTLEHHLNLANTLAATVKNTEAGQRAVKRDD